MAIVASATAPVLFSSLSRLQNEKDKFENTFFNFQKYVGLLVIPMGIGIFVFRRFVTHLFLGEQWGAAIDFIGLWALFAGFKVVLSNYCSEVYRSLGRPQLSVAVQVLQILILIPLLIYGANSSFRTLYVLRSLSVLPMIIINLLIMKMMVKISISRMFLNIIPYTISALIMLGAGIWLRNLSQSLLWTVFSIIVCILIYFGSLMVLFPRTRKDIFVLVGKVRKV